MNERKEIPVPSGARIKRLRVRFVKYEYWHEALRSVGTGPSRTTFVQLAGELYPELIQQETDLDLVLINYRRGDFETATKWAEKFGLKRTHPLEIFAIGAQYHDLRKEFNQNPVNVVATTVCNNNGYPYICYISQVDRDLRPDFLGTNAFGTQSDWFGFRE